ncbi:MAG: FG-GAP and VCBS repeat-containing protein [Acidobacteria bacterium]|nr:FG-GAP and VCBS repeat-containing protein [Acidobacteriota bacterium]
MTPHRDRSGEARPALPIPALLLGLLLAHGTLYGQAEPDRDGDGVSDPIDNCPHLANPDQLDDNLNGLGNLCEEAIAVIWNLAGRSRPGQITIITNSNFTGGMGMPMAAGDLNGDGRADLVFAPFNSHTVKGWLSDGNLGQEILFAEDGSAPAGGFVIRGGLPNFLGCEVDAADVNGDGVDDLLIGEPFADAGGVSGAGIVHVLFGGQPIPRDVDLLNPPPGLEMARIEGIVEDGHLGCWVSSADIDGDGVNDILTAATDAGGPDGTRTGAGTFYLIEGGGAAFTAGAILSVSSAALTVYGRDPSDRFGSQAAGGDFDGDGSMDLLVASAHSQRLTGTWR